MCNATQREIYSATHNETHRGQNQSIGFCLPNVVCVQTSTKMWSFEFMVEMCIQRHVKSTSILYRGWTMLRKFVFFCQTAGAGAAEPADVQLKLTMRRPRQWTLGKADNENTSTVNTASDFALFTLFLLCGGRWGAYIATSVLCIMRWAAPGGSHPHSLYYAVHYGGVSPSLSPRLIETLTPCSAVWLSVWAHITHNFFQILYCAIISSSCAGIIIPMSNIWAVCKLVLSINASWKLSTIWRFYFSNWVKMTSHNSFLRHLLIPPDKNFETGRNKTSN